MDFKPVLDQAREIFFQQNPHIANQADTTPQGEAHAEAVGCTVDELRHQRRLEAFADAAKAMGIDPIELAIRLAADSPEQADAWRRAQNQLIRNALGI